MFLHTDEIATALFSELFGRPKAFLVDVEELAAALLVLGWDSLNLCWPGGVHIVQTGHRDTYSLGQRRQRSVESAAPVATPKSKAMRHHANESHCPAAARTQRIRSGLRAKGLTFGRCRNLPALYGVAGTYSGVRLLRPSDMDERCKRPRSVAPANSRRGVPDCSIWMQSP